MSDERHTQQRAGGSVYIQESVPTKVIIALTRESDRRCTNNRRDPKPGDIKLLRGLRNPASVSWEIGVDKGRGLSSPALWVSIYGHARIFP